MAKRRKHHTGEFQAADDGPVKRESLWLARIDDLDCGPFTLNEMRQRIKAGQIIADTLVCEEQERNWQRLADNAQLGIFFRRIQEIQVQDAEADALDRQDASVRRRHRVRLTVAYVIIGIVFVAGGVVALILASGTPIYPSNYTGSIFMTTDLPLLDRWEQFSGNQQHEWRFGKDPAKKKRRVGAMRAGSVGVGEIDELVYDTSDDPVALDFNEANDSGRDLSDQEINTEVVAKVRNLVIPCLREEIARRPDFTGTTIQFALLPTGQTASIRVTDAVTPKMHACIKASVHRLHIARFAGGTRWVRIPMQISVQ